MGPGFLSLPTSVSRKKVSVGFSRAPTSVSLKNGLCHQKKIICDTTPFPNRSYTSAQICSAYPRRRGIVYGPVGPQRSMDPEFLQSPHFLFLPLVTTKSVWSASLCL